MKVFTVVFTSETGCLETYGPFETVSKAKDWMGQEFNNNFNIAKKNNKDVRWNWDEHKHGSCKIEGVGSWNVIELKGV